MTKYPVRTVFILERYIFKRDIAFDVSKLDCAFFILDIRFDIQYLGEPFKTRIAVLKLLSKIHKDSDRFSERIDVEKECNEVRDLNKTFGDKDSSRDYHDDIYEKDKCGHAGME